MDGVVSEVTAGELFEEEETEVDKVATSTRGRSKRRVSCHPNGVSRKDVELWFEQTTINMAQRSVCSQCPHQTIKILNSCSDITFLFDF